MKQFFFKSESDSSVTHAVNVYEDGRITCSCRGYRSPNKCHHFREIAAKFGIDGIGGPEEPIAKQGSLLETGREIPIKAMLARGLKEEENVEDYSASDFVLEEKWNGHRMLIETGPEVTAWSRAGNIRILPSHLVKELNKMPKALIDSELFIPGGQSTDVTAIHLQHELELAIFDIMKIDGELIVNNQLFIRRGFLEKAAAKLGQPVFLSDQFEPTKAKLQEIWDRGGEGGVLKRLDSTYEGRRSKSWIKFKKEIAEVGVIVGFEQGLLGPYSKVIALDKFGVTVSVKMLNDEWRAKLEREGGKKYIGWNLLFNHRGVTRGNRKYISPMMEHIYKD